MSFSSRRPDRGLTTVKRLRQAGHAPVMSFAQHGPDRGLTTVKRRRQRGPVLRVNRRRRRWAKSKRRDERGRAEVAELLQLVGRAELLEGDAALPGEVAC